MRRYGMKTNGLGVTFLDLIDNVIDRLCSGLLPSSPVPAVTAAQDTRRVLLKRFPYSIVFYERETEIVIIAFAHSSRRPGYWRSREL